MGDQKNPSPSTSPHSSTSSSSNSTLPPLTPKSTPTQNPNPNPNPYPTTFIQADSQSFKQVVQMLTGSADTAAGNRAPPASAPAFNPKSPIPPIAKANKKPAFKLYERRSTTGAFKNLKMISPLLNGGAPASAFAFHKHHPEIVSPSILDFPSLALSPVTPLSPDPFNRSGSGAPSSSPMSAEERAIAEKGFYLHPSPRTTPTDAEPPKLLPLFPLSSPRMMESAAAAAAAAESGC